MTDSRELRKRRQLARQLEATWARNRDLWDIEQGELERDRAEFEAFLTRPVRVEELDDDPNRWRPERDPSDRVGVEREGYGR